jgi:hypothetical protein
VVKLYVWKNAYDVRYGDACLYVIAISEDEARKAAKTARVSRFGYEPDNLAQLGELGPPDRVCDGPYAEVYEWQE